VLVEVGPQATLLAMARKCWSGDRGQWLPSLRRRRGDCRQMLESLGSLYVHGVAVDRGDRRHKVALPTYPFQRRRYWFEEPPPRSSPSAAVEVGIEDWLYEIEWRHRPLQDVGEAMAGGRGEWLIFADQGGLGQRLAELLEQEGESCTLVFPGESSTGEGADVRRIDPALPQDLERLLKSVAPCRGVFHLWSLDAASGEGLSTASLAAAQVLGCGSVLHLLQALPSAGGLAAGGRLWLVTRGAQAVASEPAVPGIAQAPLWGLGRVAAAEMPELRGVLVDLPPQPDEDEAAWLLDLLRSPEGESQVAFRDRRRYVARLVRCQRPVETPAQRSLKADASYLITGGLGALGLGLARWMVERGARHLALVGRRGAPEAAQPVLDRLRSAGAQVEVLRGDVCERSRVADLLAEIDASMPPLAGIVHAAGVLDDGVLSSLDWPRFAAVLAPKVAGAWNLHDLTSGMTLDFFVLFSSAASLLGPPAQGNYAAANAFLDALAHYRKSLGLPAVSLDWGPWAEAGMAADAARRDRRRSARGVESLRPEQGLRILEWVLHQDLAQLAALKLDWTALLEAFPAGGEPSLLAELAGEVRSAAPATERRGGLLGRLQEAPAGERRDLLGAYVRDEVGRVLGLDPAQPIEPQQGFFDLGMDSLMAVELRNRLLAELGSAVSLDNTLIFDRPTPEALTAYLEGELLGTQLPAAAEVHPAAAAEPIAIVGLGCRFPGGADDPEAFWRLLHEGMDAISEVPRERWDVDAYYDPDPEAPGKMSTRYGGFLDRIDRFDPHFFGIAPREAVSMDPQHRLLLEVSWEALEHAGIAPSGLAATRTGVFVGICGNDYSQLSIRHGDPARLVAYDGTGGALSAAAGRLSYLLGLRGPSLAVDTACSSSLVALHLACQSLHAGECDLALAGGVNVILSPEANIVLSKARMMAADGRCKTFDAAADGYVRSEGSGMVVLERLSVARRKGDRILAVIRGSAVNQDGRSVGLTAPNGAAQEAVIRDALAAAEVTPDEIGYVEAHGTGTSLGDPIEVRALDAVLSPGHSPERPFLLGSVKTNLGHLEGAAGVAALIKVVLALQHEEIPPHLHFHEPSPHIPWQQIPVQVPTDPTPWPGNGERRVAGVSSFGFIGTNAHVVVEEAPRPADEESAAREVDRPLHLLPLSARSEAARSELAQRFVAHLRGGSPSLADTCFTAGAGRSHFDHRLAVVAA
ncbi:MAG: SDR family NAD(P)-dependent oxidoreductase, partial [Thermoanaerobaculia bacterium]